MKLSIPQSLIILLMFCIGCQENTGEYISPEQAEKIFAFEVYPMLEAKCFACHGDDPEEIKGEFDIRSLESMLKGGESGHAAIAPGKPDQSPIFLAASRVDEDFAMPPKENDKLEEEQLQWLRKWIAGQAPWPSVDRRQELNAEGDWDFGGTITVKTSTARSQSWADRRYKPEDLWAFSPLKEVEPPTKFTRKNSNPIDAFIDEKLAEAGIKAAPKADKQTLIRRATYDLTGLPPTPEEIEKFLKEKSSNAYEKLIDRLLASPQYGEQWARHWLDVARYADSDGFSNDYARPNAWRYRDYVIRSFNADKPYDQFVREQIAGDEIDANNPEMLIATGFLRMGPWEHTGMAVEAETRQYYLDDVTNSVGESFMSLPLRCARCHDHKFDPIPTKDFYRIQAVFATTQFADRPAAFLPEENLRLMPAEKAQLEKWLEDAQKEKEAINKKEEEAAKAWYTAKGKQYRNKNQRRKIPNSQKPPRYLGLTDQDLGVRKYLDKRRQTLRKEKGRFQPLAFSVYNGPRRIVHSARPNPMPENLEGQADSTFILTGGSVYSPEEWVDPGVLSAVSALDIRNYTQKDTLVPESIDKRRLAFAHWLTHPRNPLTSRSIVNRIWQYHFGKGIAENSNNFGITGKKPSHPELLDWLANDFVENGWSIKRLHRQIMTSKAYMRSSQHPNPELLERKDPQEQMLAVFQPRRLTAEELRDAMLMVSGELNLEMGGIPVRPEINQEVALQPRHTMGSIARAYQPSPKPEDRNRRTIYTQKRRHFTDPLLEVFNKPPSDLSCERRTASAVSPQAFTLLNSDNSRDRSIALAHRLEQAETNLEDQIKLAIELAWNRKASSRELKDSKAYVEKMLQWHQEHPPEKEAYPTKIKRSMFEEMTGEAFEYLEKLDVYENYSPDLKPWDVEASTRALADLALVLFNSNEFIYVY